MFPGRVSSESPFHAADVPCQKRESNSRATGGPSTYTQLVLDPRAMPTVATSLSVCWLGAGRVGIRPSRTTLRGKSDGVS